MTDYDVISACIAWSLLMFFICYWVALWAKGVAEDAASAAARLAESERVLERHFTTIEEQADQIRTLKAELKDAVMARFCR